LTDEWAQLTWLDERVLGIKYLTTFRARYCIMGGYEGRSVIGQKNMDDFRAKVDPWTYRVTKKQIGYIPKRYKDWVFDLNAEQQRLIKQVKQELIADLADGDSIPIATATSAFVKVQQISNGFIIDEEGKVRMLVNPERNPRAQALIEAIEADDGKFVVWTRFIADRDIIKQAFKAAGISFVTYEGTDQERHEAKASFLSDEGVRCFIANPQSAGTGLDGLQTVCSQAIYYSNSFNAIDRWQSEDRIDRRGMIGGSIYTDLIAKGSIDRHILRNLSKKKGISDMSLGDIEELFSEF
jgi:SNF2 family DNA or RNA helicase